MRIFAPVKDFNGLRNNVRFVNGVGETDNSQLIDWFKDHGYKVAIEETQKNEAKVEKEVVTPNVDFDVLESMNPFELRQWAIDNGYGGVIRNTRSKDKLLELIRG